MVDLQSSILSQASFPCSLPTSSDIDFFFKNLHYLQSKVSFIHIAHLRLKIFISFTRLAVILFLQKCIKEGGISALLYMSVCISDLMLGVTLQWTTLPSRGCSSNTSKYFMLEKPKA